MRPVFFKLTLWNDPQKGAKRPAEWGACHGANRYSRHGTRDADEDDTLTSHETHDSARATDPRPTRDSDTASRDAYSRTRRCLCGLCTPCVRVSLGGWRRGAARRRLHRAHSHDRHAGRSRRERPTPRREKDRRHMGNRTAHAQRTARTRAAIAIWSHGVMQPVRAMGSIDRRPHPKAQPPALTAGQLRAPQHS